MPTRLPRCLASRDVRLPSRRCVLRRGMPGGSDSLTEIQPREGDRLAIADRLGGGHQLGKSSRAETPVRTVGSASVGSMLGVTGSAVEALEAPARLAREMHSAITQRPAAHHPILPIPLGKRCKPVWKTVVACYRRGDRVALLDRNVKAQLSQDAPDHEASPDRLRTIPLTLPREKVRRRCRSERRRFHLHQRR